MGVEEIRKQVIEIVSEIMNRQTQAEDRFVEDLQADSLDVIEITLALEEEFEIEIPDSKMEESRMVKVEDAVQLVHDILNPVKPKPGFYSIDAVSRQLKTDIIVLRPHIFGDSDICVQGDGREFPQPYQEFLIDLYAAMEARSAALGAVLEATGVPAGADVREYADKGVLDVLNNYLWKDFDGDCEKMIKEYGLPDGLEYGDIG